MTVLKPTPVAPGRGISGVAPGTGILGLPFREVWSIDFEFNDDVFHNQWQDYRTRAKRDLTLVSDWHDYAKPDRHKVLVKVFDIFGNDTTHLIEVRV